MDVARDGRSEAKTSDVDVEPRPVTLVGDNLKSTVAGPQTEKVVCFAFARS